MGNLLLSDKGEYRITFTDRVGNQYKIKANITGQSKNTENISSNNRSYVDLYNSIYINKKAELSYLARSNKGVNK